MPRWRLEYVEDRTQTSIWRNFDIQLILLCVGEALELCRTYVSTMLLVCCGVFARLGYNGVMCQKMARNVVCLLAFPDEVNHLIYLFLLVVEVQRLHASLEVGRGETFGPVTRKHKLQNCWLFLKAYSMNDS